MSRDKPKTIVAIRLTDKTKIDLWHVFLILGSMVLFFSILAGIQYALCENKEQKTVKECLIERGFQNESKRTTRRNGYKN